MIEDCWYKNSKTRLYKNKILTSLWVGVLSQSSILDSTMVYDISDIFPVSKFFCNKNTDNNGDLFLKCRGVIEEILYKEFGLLLQLFLLFFNIIYFTSVNSVSPLTWEVFFIMLIFQTDKL